MALPLKENYIFLVAGPLAYKFVLCFTYNVCLEKSFEGLCCVQRDGYIVYIVSLSADLAAPNLFRNTLYYIHSTHKLFYRVCRLKPIIVYKVYTKCTRLNLVMFYNIYIHLYIDYPSIYQSIFVVYT